MQKVESRFDKLHDIAGEVTNCFTYRINPVFTGIFLMKRYPHLFGPMLPFTNIIEKSKLLNLPKHLRKILPYLPNNLDSKTLYEHFISFFFLDEYIPDKDWIVFDVGAFSGFYSLVCSELAGKKGGVFAFEPNPSLCEVIKARRREKRLSNLRVVEQALGKKEELATLYMANNSKSVSSFYMEHTNERDPDFEEVEITVTTMDKFIKEANLKSVDLVKIDIEGAEFDVLLGARDSIAQGVIKRFIIEVHEDVVKAEEILDLLRRHHYVTDAFLKASWGRKYIYARKISS